MRESSGKCTGHMRALMLLHESNRPAGSTDSGLVSRASSEAQTKACELLGKNVCLLIKRLASVKGHAHAYTLFKKQKTHKNYHISKQIDTLTQLLGHDKELWYTHNISLLDAQLEE